MHFFHFQPLSFDTVIFVSFPDGATICLQEYYVLSAVVLFMLIITSSHVFLLYIVNNILIFDNFILILNITYNILKPQIIFLYHSEGFL